MNSEDILALAKSVIEKEGSAVIELISQLNEDFVRAAKLLFECKGHVLVAGSGTSHAVALRFAHLLSCCGTPSLFIHPGDSQHGLSGAVKSEDVLIVISKGGSTLEVNTLAQIARRKGAKIIGITEKPDSDLGRYCDLVLKVVSPPDVDVYGMIATGSSLVNCAYADALCVVLASMRNYSLEEFGETHPGGAVGLKIKEEVKN